MIDSKEVSKRLIDGQVIILPTDTVYGISCCIGNKQGIERIFKIKSRAHDAKFITLISSLEQLLILDIKPIKKELELIKKYWPGQLTIVFKRGEDTLAVRLPDYAFLREIISMSGPIVSTSANISGDPVVKSIREAKEIFKDSIDAYYDYNDCNTSSNPSTIVKIENNEMIILRQGAVHIA